jgi:LPXTG-motif cell wall-anchored protein
MKKIRKALSLLLALTMALSLVCFTASASEDVPAVIYDVKAKEFRFDNVEVFEHTEEDAHEHPQNVDLFRDMKNVFPGDVYAEIIEVGVENVGSNKVNLFLKAENPNEDFETLMGAGNEVAPVLWVVYDDVVYNAKLGEGIKLGQFSRRMQESEITVMLEFPLEAGNELQGLIAEIDWVFTAEVIPSGGGGGEDPEEIPDDPIPMEPPEQPPEVIIPEPPVPTTPPKTGDASMLWMALAALSGAGLVFLMMTGKKKEEEA